MNATKQHYHNETELDTHVYDSDALHQMTAADLHDLADSLDVDPELKSKQEKITAILDKQATSNQHPVTSNQLTAISDTRDCPILFDKEMVRATLSGAKTATRRLFKSPLLSRITWRYQRYKMDAINSHVKNRITNLASNNRYKTTTHTNSHRRRSP